MASLVGKVLRDKSKYNKGIRQTQRQQINDLKTESVYAYRLKEDLKNKVDKYLDDDGVECVRIVIPPANVSLFMKVMFREEFEEYSITQVGDREFELSRKEIYM